jgi:CheY-like chemotaxis protein
MRDKRRVLWIEDGARFDFPQMAAPLYMNGGYDLAVAEDATSAVALVKQSEYDVVIVDIRLPPGDDSRWIELWKRAGSNRVAARLGLELLRSLLGSDDAKVPLRDRPSWLTPDRIGVLTVEGEDELRPVFDMLGIRFYRRKQADVPDTVLLDLTRQIEQRTGSV